MNLGHTIAQLRAEKNISQRQLAKDLSVSVGVVGMWETNKRLPSLECFISIIDYFAVSADFLLKDDRKIKFDNNLYTADEQAVEVKKILETFYALNEDNKDILIGEAKKLLKNQRLDEKRSSSMAIQKAT